MQRCCAGQPQRECDLYVPRRRCSVARPPPTPCDLTDGSPQAPPSLGLSRQERGVGCQHLLQGIFLTQGLNSGLLHFKQIPYHLSHQGSPQKYTEELYKKGFNDLDNHNGVVTHLEPDILECEVSWALGSIITNKAS